MKYTVHRLLFSTSRHPTYVGCGLKSDIIDMFEEAAESPYICRVWIEIYDTVYGADTRRRHPTDV